VFLKVVSLKVLALPVMLAVVSAAGGAAYAQGPAKGPASSIAPDKDPTPEMPPIKLLDKVADKHPRLLFTADRLPQLRAFYNSPEGRLYHDELAGFQRGCTIPADRKTDAGWGQDVGVFKMPSLALYTVLTGDKKSFERCMEFLKWLDSMPEWTSDRQEMNSDTTASFTMVGASLMWDWLYNDMDPAFREKFRQTLWLHVREMYYGGHLGKNPGGNYWRGVPGYNHRWFRDWGMTLAAIAATEAKPEEQWMLGRLLKEMKFMADWLPVDGSQHEGANYGACSGDLGMAFQALDECVGTHFLDNPFFKNLAAYGLETSAPGMTEAIYFSDNWTKNTSIHPYFLKTAAYNKEADALDGIRQFLKINGRKSSDTAWICLLADDPGIKGGQFQRLPTTAFVSDLGMAIVRDSWQDRAVAAMFKCGPPGGYKLNAWRETAKERGALPYLNVAHDHPNANSFVLLGDGEYLAETDRYCEKPGKVSSSLNTILVNGSGQVPQGRPDGDDWLQPGSGDMTKMGVITAWKDAGEVVVVEGEAAGSYLSSSEVKVKTARPALDRYRRTFLWVKGAYVLVLDDIRSPKPAEITWLMQGAKLDTVDDGAGRYRLSKGKAECEFQLVSDGAFKAKIGVSTANDHSKLMGWQQLQADVETSAVRFASVYDPWRHKDVRVKLAPEGPNKATVTVESGGFRDTWQWQSAGGKFEASTLHGSRKGGFDIVVDAKSAAPPVPEK
jgi:hypothetical protein